MLKTLLLPLFLFSVLLTAAQNTSAKKTILFAGAHPDDETAISEGLSYFSRQGYTVYVIIATNGKDGTRVTSIPGGDSLGNLRKNESICGCKTLGLQPPIFFEINRLDTKYGVREHFKAHQQLLDSLRATVLRINPDIIITAGPDGDTHHVEHIVVGAAVTELLLAEGWVEKYPLYYFGFKKDMAVQDELGYVDEQYFNVAMKHEAADKRNAIAALPCYATQYTAAELKEEEERINNDRISTTYYRRFVVQKGLKTNFD